MNNQSVLITGNSAGLGRAFTEYYLNHGANVYGLSRSGCPLSHPNLYDIKVDLADLKSIRPAIEILLKSVARLDMVILNAGVLGEIQAMHTLEMQTINQLMSINVWSNKVLLDFLCESAISLDQIVAISSGAAVNGNKGWGAYSLSKASLNMLIKLYAAEYDDVHFTALAPGLVDTQMQDHLCDQAKVDENAFPSVKKLRAARGSPAMPNAAVAAMNIVTVLPHLKTEIDSGSFVDMRNLSK